MQEKCIYDHKCRQWWLWWRCYQLHGIDSDTETATARDGMGFTNHGLMAQTTQTNEEWLCVHELVEKEVE